MFDAKLLGELIEARYTPAAWRRYVAGHVHLARVRIEARPPAVRSVLATGFTLLAVEFAGAAAVAVLIDAGLARRLFAWGAVWLSVHCAWVLAHLGLLADREGRPRLRLGLANTITLFRSLTVPWMVIAMLGGALWLGLALYVLGAIADVADGALARRRGEVSRLGTVLDPLVDVAWNSAAIVGLVAGGVLPGWILALVAIRYGLLVVGAAVLYFVRGHVRIRPTLFGKASGAAIVTVIVCAFLNRLAMPASIGERLTGLLDVALGFLVSATIIYVVVLGVLNYRQAAGREAAGRVVGRVEERRAAGGGHGSR